jgi:hypothetical protein
MTQSDQAPPAAAATNAGARTTALLLQLEKEARAAPTREALGYVAVNRSRALIAYDRAVLVTLARGGRKPRVRAISNLPVIERNAPYVVWLQRALDRIARRGDGLSALRSLGREDVAAPDGDGDGPAAGEGRAAWWPGLGLWIPFRPPGGAAFGGLLLMRAKPDWTEAEQVLLESLADCYGHAWRALGRGSKAEGGRGRIWKLFGWGVGLALLAAMAIPVPQAVVAPARIVPDDPAIVAAPMDGVIEEVTVDPNDAVAPGDLLVRYEAEELEANLAVADRAVAAAEADLRRAQQQAFGDADSKAEVALKQAELDLREVERDYGRYLLSQVELRAETPGVAVFPDASDWRGRPVRTGTRILQIADPAAVRIEIDIPVGDAVAVEPGAPVSVFLDIDPLNPRAAVLERAAYGAETTEDGVLAYRAFAHLTAEEAAGGVPRIGLFGTARILGDPVPLGLFLFRKPISAIRQYLGI